MAQKKKLRKVSTQLSEELFDKLRNSVERDGTKMQTAFAEAVRLYLLKNKAI